MRWKRYAMIAGWGAVIGAFVSGMFLSAINNGANTADFAIFLTAANALRHDPHAAIYSLSTLTATHAAYGGCAPPAGWGYLYQPLFALALEPLLLLSCSAATAVWEALNVGVMLACVVWFVRWMQRRNGAGAALATAAICVLCVPLYRGLYFGQVHLIILGDCLAAVSLMRRNHPRWAGAILAAGAFLKYLPVLLLIYYLARRRWAAAVGAALAAMALGILELAVVGPTVLEASVLNGPRDGLANISVSMTDTLPYEPYVVSFLALSVYMVIYLAVARWGRADDPSILGLSVGEAWAIGAMAFASPMLWNDYLTWLLPVAVVLLDMTLTVRDRRARRLRLAGLMSLLALTFVNVPSPTAAFAALTLWLICTGILLRQIGVPLPFARRIPERVAVPQTSR